MISIWFFRSNESRLTKESESPKRKVFDILILGGTIIDGSGKPGERVDLGILGERIAALGQFDPKMGKRVIQAQDLTVAPGFIDPHTHSDFTLPLDPMAESKIRQGVTTEIAGNCGFSVFPINREYLPAVKDYVRFFPGELSWQWLDYEGYQRELAKGGIACNFASLVGHGMIRLSIRGFSPAPLRPEELHGMTERLQESLDQGALGLSFGLAYAPGSFAEQEELILMARKTKGFSHALVTVHLRDEGDQLIPSVLEMIELAERAELPVHIGHHKATGLRNWGKVSQSLGLMDEAVKRGSDLTCDVYPYTAANTTLVSLFPKSDMADGVPGLLRRLLSAPDRSRIACHLESQADQIGGWEKIRIATVKSERNKSWEGKNVAEIAGAQNTNPAEALMDLCLEERGAVNVVFFYIREEDLEEVMRHPRSMFGSDGKVLNRKPPLNEGKPHPRNFGAFPRILGRYVRDRKILSLPEAIEKMTYRPAQRFSLERRGLIREGFYADLTLFDANRIQDRATFDLPQQYPEGIEYVLVNGQIVLEKGQLTGALPGKILRRRPS